MSRYRAMRGLEPSVLTAIIFVAGCALIWLPWQLGRLICRWLGLEEVVP
jgi:hypothetical protein